MGCILGTPPNLDDLIACTLDACDELADVVTHTPDDALCDNADFCDGDETCDVATGCVVGTAPFVDDGIACTIDGCDEEADIATHVPDHFFCDDADPCTVETCDEVLGCTTEVIPGCGVALPLGDAKALAFALMAAGSMLLMANEARRRGTSRR
jgi:hypothetical protein